MQVGTPSIGPGVLSHTKTKYLPPSTPPCTPQQVGDYTPDEDQPKTPFTHEQLLSRILELLERGFSVQGVLDVAQCTDYMDEQAILYSLVSELLIPSHMVRRLAV